MSLRDGTRPGAAAMPEDPYERETIDNLGAPCIVCEDMYCICIRSLTLALSVLYNLTSKCTSILFILLEFSLVLECSLYAAYLRGYEYFFMLTLSHHWQFKRAINDVPSVPHFTSIILLHTSIVVLEPFLFGLYE